MPRARSIACIAVSATTAAGVNCGCVAVPSEFVASVPAPGAPGRIKIEEQASLGPVGVNACCDVLGDVWATAFESVLVSGGCRLPVLWELFLTLCDGLLTHGSNSNWSLFDRLGWCVYLGMCGTVIGDRVISVRSGVDLGIIQNSSEQVN